MSRHHYTRSTNPFDEDDDVDDETFLKNTRRPPPSSFDDQLQSYQERRKIIEERTLNSTDKSISILRDSEQIGIATAEELMRQREKLEKTDKQLDEINATLRFSQKHINGIKSVFSSLKNYMAGKNEASASPVSPSISKNDENEGETAIGRSARPAVYSQEQVTTSARLEGTSGGSKEFNARLDANLEEMCTNITRLKGLAGEMSLEIDSQNDLIGNIIDKTEQADMTITRQSKDMVRLLKK